MFGDPDYDLSNVTKTLRNIPITDINRDNMYKIMNKGLYMGKVAHDYQRTKKGVGLGSPILVPPYCIYILHITIIPHSNLISLSILQCMI